MTEACIQGVDTGFMALGYAKVAVLGVAQGITGAFADFFNGAHADRTCGARMAGSWASVFRPMQLAALAAGPYRDGCSACFGGHLGPPSANAGEYLTP